MYPLSPDKKSLSALRIASSASGQQGIALVVALVMLLVLVGMAVATTYVATIQANMVSAVTGKAISIDAGETCFDNAIEWLSAGAGQTWINGEGKPLDLTSSGYALSGLSLLTDTVALGLSDTRSALAKDRASRAEVYSCVLEKAASTTTRGVGYEIGTSNGYGASSFVYTVRMTAIGHVNVKTNGSLINPTYWQPNSGRSTLELVLDYTP